MSGWHYADRNRQQHGPVTAEELVAHYRNGSIALDGLVWREGMPQWQPLRDFADELGLSAAPEAAPEPPPPLPSTPPLAAPATATFAAAPPRKRMSGGMIALIVIAALALPCLGFGAILAAISVPAYNDYTLRAKVAQALGEAASLKLAVAEFQAAEERCPSNGEGDIGAPESYAGTYTTRATVGAFDDGTCGFELEIGNTGETRIDGRKIWWERSDPDAEWRCSSEIDDKWLPPHCRG